MAIIGQNQGTYIQTPGAVRLDASHRCDRCGAQAYIEVILITGGLLTFCGHHWKAVRQDIEPLVDSFHDELARLEKGVEKE